ncbi:hypothetical protein Acid345_1579 [Candidatus Koribacter versatilis Ellin345]|uniref:Uncharacterized protein n=1 Tax=Koribacter versatilis (strain Ellin345) TaxID=204669 RepID=Q1IRB9_KORVE|nr:hypothetical protein [Candidatus Koribacter versatilis]ABF40581.1 hypothetical protein Acid345_1579 [Candidatus Koribacter versatilis Ellin345]
MRVGAESKKKTIVAITLFSLALLAVVYELWPPSQPAATPATTGAETKGHVSPVFSKLDPSLRLDLLKGSEEVAYSGSGRDIFHSAAAPDIPKPDDPIRGRDETKATPPPPAVHQNPPIPLKFYGFASSNNKKQIFLAQGEDVFVAKEGDIVKGRYKVLRVGDKNVEIQDVLQNYSQQIPLTLPNS